MNGDLFILLCYNRHGYQVTYVALQIRLTQAASELTLMEWVTSMDISPIFAFWIIILQMPAILFMFI